jgi:hypothetical protein
VASLRDKDFNWITYKIVIIIGALLCTFGIFYFGFIGLFNVLSIHYDDFHTLLIFTILYFIFSLFTDILYKITLAMIRFLNVKPAQIKWILAFISSFFINLAMISILDQYMDSIFIAPITKIIVSALLAMLDLVVDSDKLN